VKRGPYSKYPASLAPEILSTLEAEPLSFETLTGIFAAYRNDDVDRKSLIKAISDWQITEAKGAMNEAYDRR
jgi:hypothetical protein